MGRFQEQDIHRLGAPIHKIQCSTVSHRAMRIENITIFQMNLLHCGARLVVRVNGALQVISKRSNIEEYNHIIREKLLGFPTSMAFEMVSIEGRGRKIPESRNSGTASLILVEAIKRCTGNPIRLAMMPAVRFPKLPLGTENAQGQLVRFIRLQP